MTIFTKDKNDPQIKLEEMTSGELLAFLKATPVAEWNAQYIAARHRRPPYGANLYGANLYGANLREANLYGANLYGANLCGANLREANLCGANLYRANLRGANLRGANLYGANLRGANLCGANLREANLYGANLYGANLRGANLYGANLRGANLYGANLYGANLYGADGSVQKLTGKHLLVGPVAGYHVSLFATEDGHAVRAGCWTGNLDGMIARAIEDGIAGERLREVLDLHGYLTSVLASWTPKASIEECNDCSADAAPEGAFVRASDLEIDTERTLESHERIIDVHNERITSLEQSRAALAESLRGNQ